MGINRRRRPLKGGKVRIFYEAVVHNEGIVVDRSSFDTLAAATEWHNKTRKRYQSGLGGLDSDYTFGQCFKDYEESDFKLLRKSSQQARSSRFRYFYQAPIWNVKMSHFSSKTVDSWVEWMRSHQTVQNKNRVSFTEELRIMKLVLNWYREHHDEGFVIPILKRHRKRSVVKVKDSRVPDYFIKPEDVPRWLAELKRRPDPVYHRLGLVMVLTGCRMGEAVAICGDAVDEGQGLLRIIRTLSWDYHSKEPYFQNEVKTVESRRVIALPDVLTQLFGKMKSLSFDKKGPLFLNAKGKLLRDNTIRDNFNAAFKACNLPWSGSHIARHTSGTLALVAGSDLPQIQALLGHTDTRQTQQYAKIVALHGNDAPLRTAKLVGLS